MSYNFPFVSSTISYTLIRSKRRTLGLNISKEGILIARAPLKMNIGVIEHFIKEKEQWIQKHQERMRIRNKNIESKIYSEGELKEIKQKLKYYIVEWIDNFIQEKNLPKIKSIKITKSEQRWGSCSAKNGLCFSYRLGEYLAPGKSNFIDAIIVHELAHLLEKNHQKPFWNLMYDWMPDYETIMKKYKSGGFFAD